MANPFAVINIGQFANDGVGDSLRVAFEKVNLNFSNIGNVATGNGSGNISGNVQVLAFPNTIVERDDTGSGFFNVVNANAANVKSISIDNNYTLPIIAGAPGQALFAGANGSTSWSNISATAPGSPSQIVFNNGGQLFADAGLTTDGNNVIISGNISSLNSSVTNITIANIAKINGTANSTSTSSGALIVAGGISSSGNIYAANMFSNGEPVLTALSLPQSNIFNLGYNNLGTSQTVIDIVSTNNITSIGYYITAIDNINGNKTSLYVNMLFDGANISITQFGLINSVDNVPAATFDAAIAISNINLLATGNSSNVSIIAQRITMGSTTPIGNVIAINTGIIGFLQANTPIVPGNRYSSSVINFSNQTVYALLPGNAVNNQTASWAATLAITAGLGISIKSAAIIQTASGSNIILNAIPITFNNFPFLSKMFLTTPTITNPTFVVTDPINIKLDPNFDYWIYFYFDADAAGNNATLGMYRNLLSGALVGGQSVGNIAGIATTPTLTAYNATGIWSINSRT